MKKLGLKLLAAIMALSAVSLPTAAFAETELITENFNDGTGIIMKAESDKANDAALDANITDAEEGDEAYGKVFATSGTTHMYFKLGKTFKKENANIAKISFDLKMSEDAKKNLLFYLGDSEQLNNNRYSADNNSYRKRAIYFSQSGKMGVSKDSTGTSSWWTVVSGTEKTYENGKWYKIEIIVDLYKQIATYTIDGEPWGASVFSAAGALESMDFFGVKTEKKEASGETVGSWYIDNITVADVTEKIDESVLFEADFEDISTLEESGVTHNNASALADGYGDEYGNVVTITGGESKIAYLYVPVGAEDPTNKSISVSFDLYAEEENKYYCMLYLYDKAGTGYKLFVRNTNNAEGQTGYFKHLHTSGMWAPTGKVDSPGKTWVRVDGILNFREDQVVIKWYFNGEYAGETQNLDAKNIDYLRFGVAKTSTAGLNSVYAVDNLLIRQYNTGYFTAECEASGSGAGTTVSVTPLSVLGDDVDLENAEFKITNTVTGKEANVTNKEYKDGKVLLTVDGLEYNGVYTVSSTNFKDLFGQTMVDAEFNALPQYDTDDAILPAVNAVWLYDYDGNRLAMGNASTEVNKIKIIFNTTMNKDSLKNGGVSIDGLTLNDGSYDDEENSYTADWGGYLEPSSTYTLNIKGAKSIKGKAMDYTANISTGDGKVSIKSIELLNSAGEAATRENIENGETLKVKVQILNTTDEPVNSVVAYGIYKNSYMQEHDFVPVYAKIGEITPVEFEVPYTDADALLKVFTWDNFSELNSYFNSCEFSFEQ